MIANPYLGVVGWCHNCERMQWGDDARWLPMWWNDGDPDWACVACDDEPWGMGVWIRSKPGAVPADSELGHLVTAGASLYDVPEHLDHLLSNG